MQHSCTSPELATSTPPHADSRMIRRRLSDKDLKDLDNPKQLKRLTSAHLEALALDGLKSLLQARGFHLVTHVTSMTKNERKTSAPGYKKQSLLSVLNPFPYRIMAFWLTLTFYKLTRGPWKAAPVLIKVEEI